MRTQSGEQMSGNGKVSQGYRVIEEFIPESRLTGLLQAVKEFMSSHRLTEIYRPVQGRDLRYRVIDGLQIRDNLPEIWDLAHQEVLEQIQRSFSAELMPLAEEKVRVNVNLMPPGRSEYRWHYDRNMATALIYLNAVEGGETEIYPNYRLLLPGQPGRLQRWLDLLLQLRPLRKTFGRKTAVSPAPGRLLVFRGDRSWHSVRPVVGEETRINLVFAYDHPGRKYRGSTELDSYLYTDSSQDDSDPNYG